MCFTHAILVGKKYSKSSLTMKAQEAVWNLVGCLYKESTRWQIIINIFLNMNKSQSLTVVCHFKNLMERSVFTMAERENIFISKLCGWMEKDVLRFLLDALAVRSLNKKSWRLSMGNEILRVRISRKIDKKQISKEESTTATTSQYKWGLSPNWNLKNLTNFC